MRELKEEEIQKLANLKGVRKIAVENFLGTMGTDDRAAKGNLWLDAQSYKWNGKTVSTIRRGIEIASRL